MQSAGFNQVLHFFGRHVPDVGHTRLDSFDLARIQIDTCDLKTGFSIFHRQWKADISESDHADVGLLGPYFV